MNQRKYNGRQARWCMDLTPYDFVILHRPGKSNPADAPSRLHQGNFDYVPKEDLLAPIQQRIVGETLTIQDFIQGTELDTNQEPYIKVQSVQCSKCSRSYHDLYQFEDKTKLDPEYDDCDITDMWHDLDENQVLPNCQVQKTNVVEDIYSNEISTNLKELIQISQSMDKLSQNRINAIKIGSQLPKNWHIGDDDLLMFKERLYVPTNQILRTKIVQVYHDDPLAGHFAAEHTENLVKRKFFWPNIALFIKNYTRTCPICQHTITPRH